jgi:hypothetical protein
MAVHYKPFDNELVSVQWYSVLSAARRAGVSFHVNEGHRTMARQWYFWNLYKAGKGNLAAYPSTNAPHIRTGRIDHALDVEATTGGASRLTSWMRRHGLPANFTVRGEPWHIETTAAALNKFYAKNKGGRDVGKLKVLSSTERKLVNKRYYHAARLIREARSGKGPRYLRELGWARYYKARIKTQMRAIQVAARRRGGGGWKKKDRGARYQILKLAYYRKLDL